jgi:hypothetical protein
MAPAMTPGSLGVNDAADPNVGVCLAGDTPGPVGSGSDHGDPNAFVGGLSFTKIPILLFNMDQVNKFFDQVARTKRDAETLKVVFHGGLKDIESSKPGDIDVAATQLSTTFRLEFYEAASEGPESAVEYLQTRKRDLDAARASIQSKYDEIKSFDQKMGAAAGWLGRGASVVKFGADVTLEVLALIPGASVIVPLVYGGTTSVIENLNRPSDAKVVGLVKEGTKAAAGKAADTLGEFGERQLAQAEKFSEEAAEKKYWADFWKAKALGKQSGKASKLLGRVQLRTLEAEAAEAGARKALISGVAFKSLGKITFVFAAVAVKEAWENLEKNWESFGQ